MTTLITRFGILAVFLLMVPESACVPIPSELTLLFSGLAVHQGWMSFPLAVLAATAGNLAGSLLAYAVGARGLHERLPGARRVVERWGELIDRRGARAVLIARLLPLARTFVALPAGARHLRLAPFIGYTVLGSAIWAAGFVLLGSLFAHEWQTLNSVLGRALLLIALLALAVMAHVDKRRRQAGQSGRRPRHAPE